MTNEVRIIGGSWRGRRIRFPAEPGLRPTPNRVRETLFNWLKQDLEGLRCLDLFAGSGALGFEAASRGAARVVQVELGAEAFAALVENRNRLSATRVAQVRRDALLFLAGEAEPFDIVFLDPPFHRGLISGCCSRLEENGWLANRARIYIESERDQVLDHIPKNWQILKADHAGEVSYHLCQRNPAPTDELPA